MRVSRDGGDTGDLEVEGFDLVAEFAAEGQDEAAQATVHVKSDLTFESDLTELGDGIDGAVAIIARGSNESDGVGVDVAAHPVQINLGRDWVHGCDA